jgi:hypothetical protein
MYRLNNHIELLETDSNIFNKIKIGIGGQTLYFNWCKVIWSRTADNGGWHSATYKSIIVASNICWIGLVKT